MTKIPPDQNTSWPKYLLTIPIRYYFFRNSLGMYTIHYVISCLFRFIEFVPIVQNEFSILVQRMSTRMYVYTFTLLRSVESPRRRPRLFSISYKYKKYTMAFRPRCRPRRPIWRVINWSLRSLRLVGRARLMPVSMGGRCVGHGWARAPPDF